ncbi:MAG: aromatic aminobenezylarsenical efflux permease ArsG family transporter [Bacteroidales bacterium]
MEFLQHILENSSIPILTAFVLGVLTAISPCPMATNITAIGYITRDIESNKRLFRNGILYALGRIITYSILGLLLIPILRKGASLFSIQNSINTYGEMFMPPILVIIGLLMLFSEKLNLPKFGFNGSNSEKLKDRGGLGALLLGIVLSLAFCPSSGILFFGMLIPMAAADQQGYILPIIFAIATSLPVILISWILAYSVSKIGKFYNRMQSIEVWLRKAVALIFIAVGLYYAYINYI